MLGCCDRYEFDDLVVLKIVNGPFKTNCYLIEKQTNRYLIDPGLDVNLICDVLKSVNIDKIDKILCTHGHFDHAAGCNMLSKEFGATPYLHSADFKIAKTGKFQMMMCGVDHQYTVPSFTPIEKLCDPFISIYHVPGHTPGSVAIKVDELYFTGDTLYLDIIPESKLPGYDKDSLRNSEVFLRNLIGLNSFVLSGHGRIGKINDQKCV